MAKTGESAALVVDCEKSRVRELADSVKLPMVVVVSGGDNR